LRDPSDYGLLPHVTETPSPSSTATELSPFDGIYGRRQVQHLHRFIVQLRAREREDAHGNRRLFLSDLFVAQLLAFHFPIVRSLRTLDALSSTATAQQVLSVERLPRSTVSDTNKVVNAELLQPLLADLMRKVEGRTLPHELDVLVKRLVAVDATFLRIVGELTWTLRQRTDNGRTVSKPRLDVQFDVASHIPRFAVLSGHDRSECNAVRRHIEPGKIYVGDKAYFGFALLRDWLEHEADFVVALNSQIRFVPDDTPVETGAEPEDGVLSDRYGHLPGCDKSEPPQQRLREVVLRGKDDEPLRLLTSLTDPKLSPTLIGELYRQRWQIELFFRWLKSCAQFRHAISHSQNGLSAALYVALLATLLMAATTGRRPSKYTLAAMQFIAAGMAELDQMLPSLERFERERQQAKRRREERRAKK
jgi:hypothetical protein